MRLTLVFASLCLVWERQAIAEDHDSICDICKEMVQEARDQLQSNETQEELKEVFEGSCNLMPVKMVRLNCIKVLKTIFH